MAASLPCRSPMLLLVALVLVLILGPLLFGVAGWRRARDEAPVARRPWNWTLVAVSALLYTLAFNLIFFVQELFLVLPKALTPGLRPTLFHNNHRWEGQHALASLFQGTGALATILAGLLCLALLRRANLRSMQARLFLLWMAYCGLLMALPQGVIGAVSAGSDVGMAMDYLHLSVVAKHVVALLCLVSMPLVALALLRPVLELATSADDIATFGARTRFVVQAVVLPVLIGTALVIPFRVPREALEVVFLPVIVGFVGAAWMVAGAWYVRDARPSGSRIESLVLPLLAAIALLLVFQLLLRPGVAFY